MSIMQDYEEIQEIIGFQKYNAIDGYIKEFGKVKEWEKESKELRKIKDVVEWEKKYSELCKRCKPLFIEDVVQNKEEWEKFEKWFEEKSKTYIIEIWKTTADRNNGFGQIVAENLKDLGQAIRKAKEIFETTNCVSIEVQNATSRQAKYFRDKVSEKYFGVDEQEIEEDLEENEPE